MGHIMLWYCPSFFWTVCPSTIAIECIILKNLCLIRFKVGYDLDMTKTLDAIDFEHSMKNKMNTRIVLKFKYYLLSYYILVIMTVGKKEHQRVDNVPTDMTPYSIQSLETISFAL